MDKLSDHITVIADRKRKLEKDISNLLNEFTIETSLEVKYLSTNSWYNVDGGKEYITDIKIEI